MELKPAPCRSRSAQDLIAASCSRPDAVGEPRRESPKPRNERFCGGDEDRIQQEEPDERRRKRPGKERNNGAANIIE